MSKVLSIERIAEIGKQHEPSAAAVSHSRNAAPSVASLPPALQLQQMVGNLAVQRLLRSGAIQAKLAISQPGDVYEREADQVAERIMNMPAVGTQPVAQRVALPKEERDEGKSCITKAFRAAEQEASNGALSHAEEAVSVASNSTGHPLPSNLHRKLEQALGADLSALRVHTGSQSVEANKAISARAYTIGHDIHFNEGQYNPESSEGQGLLAHEATHVVQQASGRVPGTPAPGGVRLDSDGLASQQDSTASGRVATTGGKAHAANLQVRRQPAPSPVIPAVGLAVSAATFALSTRPSGTDSFGNTNVQFRYSRDTPGPKPPAEIRHTIFELDTNKSFGSSSATLNVVLRYDGHNILSAFTEQARVEGYEGGIFGSEAAINFNAVQVSEPTNEVTSAYVLVQGFNNPSGPGFQRFRARILVTGDGKIEPQECVLTGGEGIQRTSPWCFIGFTDLHAKDPAPVPPEPLPPDLSGAGLPTPPEPRSPTVGVPSTPKGT